MTLRIRQTKDYNLIHKLDRRFFPADDPVQLTGTTWWIVEDAQGVAGFAGMRPLKGESTGFLSRVGVSPRLRGKGVQRRLIRLREAQARREGLRWIITYTAPDNWPSIANLLKSGYQVYDPAWRWVGSDAVYFIKKIGDADGRGT